jgi:1-deoxy-D-xylulose-5-phosphate reductoisomerase
VQQREAPSLSRRRSAATRSGTKRLTVLGATGSVGASTLDLVDANPGDFEVIALTGNSNVDRLIEIARRHRPRFAVIGEAHLYPALKVGLAGMGIETAAGHEAVAAAAAEPADCVMAAIMGAAGLVPTLRAVETGVRVALANKECLVSAGRLFMRAVEQAGAELIPVDSEHAAVFQALAGGGHEAIERLVLTASGGPFRTWPAERLADATREDALKHPNWSMGRKITVDSATLMNKGLELIEAFHLFPVRADQLDVVVHPQSIVHCLVSFADGSVLAQMAEPDMRTPIALALAWPGRMAAPTKRLDLAAIGQLTFEAPDEARFPCLALAREALRRGGMAPAVLNSANEVAVEAFLAGRIGYLDIARTVEHCLQAAERLDLSADEPTLEAVLAADAAGRALAASRLSLDFART